MTVEISRVQEGPIPPGAVGTITALHAIYYAEHWGFDIRFEAEVARELGDFAVGYEQSRDGLWLASKGAEIIGSLVIDRQSIEDHKGRLRWFIVDPRAQAGGVGRRMLSESLDFCRDKGDRGLFLKTFAGLDAARRLYESVGFVLTDEVRDTDWNEAGIVHQTFELNF